MQAFDYARATTIDETLTLLDQAERGQTRLLAGGTDLLTLMKGNIAAPTALLDIKRIADVPRGISETADGLTLGALTTLTEIEQSSLLAEKYPVLSEAAGLAATPQLRNMATIGGNLLQRPRCWYFRNQHFACWLKGGEGCPAREGENQQHALFGSQASGGSPCCAVHPSDLAAALLAVDAQVHLRGTQGERHLPLADFFALPQADRRRETTIADDELLLSLQIPQTATQRRSTYIKAMDRKVWSFALVGVAAAAQVVDGKFADVRLVLSGVAPIPWRATVAEAHLIGADAHATTIARAAAIALQEAVPLAQNRYKVPLATRLIERALTAITN